LDRSGRSLIVAVSLNLPAETEGNRKNLSQDSGIPDEIRTEQLPYTITERYQPARLEGRKDGEEFMRSYQDLKFSLSFRVTV
jgi:hypothetical protein